ncbi:primosomal protein DnaI [Peptococcaceae bacterium SCADC1_2_3]|jgi:DNA replication protein|nr:primosomal protein DnaI [Peptococcaceae bacterium SCADC1_2_3]KFI36069.1 primosomal protein DnaI [Peptococcaceae bacterium SCADC1_2_3]KFI37212.1 primosomal protein DnaI [Peptococcaceae bacterium SCADC1_2_3]HBQ28477.1 DnaD domain protein [Desulfotomaculum sp.]HCJ78811.1 DnaD domain protein [Desulfotomaculum sp.]
MTLKVGKTVKRYDKGNITAAFGADLFIRGVTSIPNLLLRYYPIIGLSDAEMMLLIQLLRLRTEEKEYYPSPEVLAECLTRDYRQIEHDLASLLEKEMLSTTQYYNEERKEVFLGYDFEPLYEKISEIWACTKVKEIEKIRQVSDGPSLTDESKLVVLVKTFENEFGRPLSPIEIEQIEKWALEADQGIILEALRRAVLMGKHNFKYIDRILLRWQKNNLRNLEAITAYDQQFLTQKDKKNTTPPRNEGKKNTNTKKKELIKNLYLS